MRYSTKWFIQLKSQILGNHHIGSVENWKQHLISLYIIRKNDGICLFSHHFQLGLISQIENQLVGMGFTALARMMQEIVDSSSRLNKIDLGEKKVLIDERKNLLAVLVTTQDNSFLHKKLEELTDHFEKIFELQQQINLETCVRLEDYALTSELVSLVFKDRPKRVLEIIPVIFKSIRKNDSIFSNQEKKLLKRLNPAYAKEIESAREVKKTIIK
ncbi:MAG: hypothetical protein JSW11_15470 [Candidatus Heimdallarchaeota archaeon]|nr:MAG: hypothetical protein JSW11_15470 [Candidatus Heimdallarchaeota archaeon]